MSRVARSSIPRSPSRPTPTSSRWKGSRWRSPGSRRVVGAWDREAATRIFTGATLAFAGVAALFGSLFVHAVWDASRDKFVAVADALDRAGASMTDRVMSIDASGTKYWSGRGGVVLVNDPMETIEQVARAYDIRWVVLDREDGVDAIAPILDGGARPAWWGEPVLAVGQPLRLAVYPVESAP